MPKPEPEAISENAKALAADLLTRIALNAEGQPFNPEDEAAQEEADAGESEFVSVGEVRFEVVDANARELAEALGAVDPGEPERMCMKVRFEPTAAADHVAMGRYVVLHVGDVPLTFMIWFSYADAHDPSAPDLGPGAIANPDLDAIQPSEALLVQIVETDESLSAADGRPAGA